MTPAPGGGRNNPKKVVPNNKRDGDRHRQFPLPVQIVVAAVLMHVLAQRGTAGSAV